METATEPQTGLGQELLDDAQRIGESAKDRLTSEVDARKGDAADQAKSLSSAISNAAGQLGGDSPRWLRSAFEQTAQTLQSFAETIDTKDTRQLTRDVQTFARQHPASFLAGCALAGFAAARVFKAGASDAAATAGPVATPYQPYGQSNADRPAMPFAGAQLQGGEGAVL